MSHLQVQIIRPFKKKEIFNEIISHFKNILLFWRVLLVSETKFI